MSAQMLIRESFSSGVRFFRNTFEQLFRTHRNFLDVQMLVQNLLNRFFIDTDSFIDYLSLQFVQILLIKMQSLVFSD